MNYVGFAIAVHALVTALSSESKADYVYWAMWLAGLFLAASVIRIFMLPPAGTK